MNMKIIGSKIKENETYLKREDYSKNLLRKLKAEKKKVSLGGGEKALEKHKAKGKIKTAEHRGYNKAIEVVESLSVWNRIKFLFSPTVLRACKSLK